MRVDRCENYGANAFRYVCHGLSIDVYRPLQW